MTCPDCDRYKKSAALWRNKAYELAGTPLPWKPDEVWVGMAHEEKEQFAVAYFASSWDRKTAVALMDNYEAHLKEKNT